MPDYTRYTLDDFALDESFQRWVLTDSPDDQVFWNNWLQTNPDKLDLVLEAHQFVLQMRLVHENLTDEEVDREVSRLQTARQQLQNDSEPEIRPFSWKWLQIAAAVFVVGLGSWFFRMHQATTTPLTAYQQRTEQRAGKLQEVRNETATDRLVRLPDGSRVTLRAGSWISFPNPFTTQHREVFLIGEAFFEVVRRPKQPFMVYTNQLTTKVLGTSFTVRAYESDPEAKVIVRTGKVSVFTTPTDEKPGKFDEQPAFILTPNQQVTFDRQARQITRSLVATPEPIIPAPAQPQTVVYDHTPVVNVFKKLESMYGILINYDADLLSGCELTAEFGSESLFEKLDLICRATESRYEVIDAQVVIYSKGCQ